MSLRPSRPVVVALATIALVGLVPSAIAAAAGVKPPRGWPSTMLLGMQDPEHGAADLRREAPLGLRYHYLSGGVNTGAGWQTFAGGDGAFVGDYVRDSQANGFLTLFTHYMLQQSAPGNAQSDERLKTIVNLASRSTMKAYFEDLRVFFQRAAATGVDPIVLHVEPDAWGYAQRSATGDDARSVPAQVASTGLSELAGLPNNVAGFAQAIVRLRNRYAPNVLLGYPVSIWGTGEDIAFSHPPDDRLDALAGRSSAFYRSLGASFDLLFFEFADRDAGYRQYVDGAGRTGWWDIDDFHRNERYVGDMTSALRRPGVMWQIPLGNTRMRAMNDTRGHYQDNRVETLLDSSRVEMKRYRDAGVIGLLFGNAVDGTTCACDATGDGVTNPAPIDGNVATSLSADDDGGFFKQAVRRYVAQGPLRLGVAPQATAARFSLRATAQPRSARRGSTIRVAVRVTSSAVSRATIGVEIRRGSAAGHRQRRMLWSSRRFAPGRMRPFSLSWHVPKDARPGAYVVVVRAVQQRGSARLTTTRRAATISVRR